MKFVKNKGNKYIFPTIIHLLGNTKGHCGIWCTTYTLKYMWQNKDQM